MSAVIELLEKMAIRVRPQSMARKIALYAVITMVLYGAVIVIDNAVLVDMFGETSHPDLDVYRDRTQTILDGKLLYRDVHTETPPLINYILIPAQLLGGSEHDWVWSAYFSFFAFLLASMMYMFLRKQDEWKAYLAGGIVLLSPFTFIESGTGEDESIMAFIFMLGVLLMAFQHRHKASIVIGAGIWTKMFPILLAPVHFLQQRSWKDRAMVILFVLAATALIALPFIILCWDDFSFFLDFYFLGNDERPTGGSSVWHFLNMGGWGVPSIVQLGILGMAMVFAYLYPYFKKWPVWPSVTLMVLVFFAFYPKIHGGYWIIPVALLSVWAVDDRRIFWRILLAFVPLIMATAFALGEGTEPPVEFYGSWLLGLFLALIGLLMFADAVRLALNERSFIDSSSDIDGHPCSGSSELERKP